jgi:competence ComEA-like helix-hairpin-helix protein
MMFWDKLSERHAWRTSLLLKIGTLGIGIIVVLLAGWPQPQVRNLDHSSVPIMLSENTRIQEVPRESISVPVISPKVDLASSSIEREGSDFQPDHMPLLVDLNGSSRMELEALPGIGMVLADRIVSYRSTYGGFQHVGDLVNVSGIGEKRLRRLEPFVTVETLVRDIGS